jgi:hypothetical protein
VDFRSVAKFLVPDWWVIVDSGIGLSYRPARLHRRKPVQQPYARVDYISQSGTKNLASGFVLSSSSIAKNSRKFGRVTQMGPNKKGSGQRKKGRTLEDHTQKGLKYTDNKS